MYQWIEETETRYDSFPFPGIIFRFPTCDREFKEPDGTIRKERRYSYNTAWRSDVVNSNSFDDPRHHQNPRSMPVGNMEWTADRTSVGRYELSHDAVAEISDFRPLNPSREVTNAMTVYGDTLYSGNPQRPEVSKKKKFSCGATFFEMLVRITARG